MDDQTDLFAQLTRLHVQGLLTDEEYEAKKAALRSRGLNMPETDGSVDRDTNSGGPAAKSRYAYAAALGIAVVGFIGLLATQTNKPDGGNAAMPTNEGGDTQAAELPDSQTGDAWSITTERDPMTDVSYQQALIKVSGQQADATIQATCRQGALGYTLTTFDKNGETTPMRVITTEGRWVDYSVAGSSQRQAPRYQAGGSYINYQIRAGSGEALTKQYGNPRYNNQIAIVDPSAQEFLRSLATADKGTWRVQMPYGDETYTWSQSAPEFKQSIAACLNPTRSPTPMPASNVSAADRQGFTAVQAQAVKVVQGLEEQCRGGSGDDPSTMKACDTRLAAIDRMIATGVCWGREDQYEAEYTYHLCERGSIGFADSPQGKGAR